MANERILIVDDSPTVLHLLEKHLRHEGYTPLTASCAKEAISLMRRETPDLVLLDIYLPDANGLDLLRNHLLPELGNSRVIILSGHGARQDAEEAVLVGAYDYLSKPVSLPRLGIAIRNCLRLNELAKEVAEFSGGTVRSVSLRDLIGVSPQMVTLVEHVKQVATFDVPVMILGENGTGKELVARAIHALSPRRKGLFVPIDCGALPDTLVEAEIFGYERGAFSGAVQAKPGKLERANGGTVLLDEIGNFPPLIQPKLLRVLQSQEVERLGSRHATKVDVRVLSATNADVDRMVAEGSFRRDLYHRLNTVRITVPPLRERTGDISLLARYALLMANRAFNKQVRGISPDAMAVLDSYAWPGNVRELENCMRSAVIAAGRIVEPHHLPQQVRTMDGPPMASFEKDAQSGKSLAEVRSRAAEEAERAFILRTLEETGWNKAEAARRMKVDYKALFLRMRKYGIQKPRGPSDANGSG
jgi:DNA-binding NtrC family response regulator